MLFRDVAYEVHSVEDTARQLMICGHGTPILLVERRDIVLPIRVVRHWLVTGHASLQQKRRLLLLFKSQRGLDLIQLLKLFRHATETFEIQFNKTPAHPQKEPKSAEAQR